MDINNYSYCNTDPKITTLETTENDDVIITLEKVINWFGEIHYTITGYSYDGQLDILIISEDIVKAYGIYNKLREYIDTPPSDNTALYYELESMA